MVKFKWPIDKVHVQRLILLSITGMISFGIIKGHLAYEREVSEYMRLLEHHKAKEASLGKNKELLVNRKELTSVVPSSSSAEQGEPYVAVDPESNKR